MLGVALPEVGAVACGGCGAPLVLTALVGHARCPGCGHQQALPAGLGEQLAAYQAAVAAQVPAIVARVGARELWAHRGRTGATRSWALVIVAVLFLLELLVGWPVSVLLDKLDVVPFATSLTVGLVVFGVVTAAAIGVGVYSWSGAGRTVVAPQITLPDVDVACSACGAPTLMRAGQTVAHCAHCRAQLVASREKVARVVEIAAGWLRRAALEQHATQRAVWAPRTNRPLLQRDDASYAEQVRAAHAKPDAVGRAAWMSALAHGLGGAAVDGDAMQDWLDRHWAGVYGDMDYFWKHPRHGVACRAGDFSALVDDAPAIGDRAQAGLNLVVATDASAAPAHTGELEAMGFSVRVTEAGLEARARPEVTAALLARQPDVAFVRRALDALGRAAVASGRRPTADAPPT